LDLTLPFNERFRKIAQRVSDRPGYRYEHFKIKEMDKYLNDFKVIYDKAWAYHENFTPINVEDLHEQFRQLKPIMDEEMILFAYHDDEPIGFLVMAPDANQVIYYLNGHLNSIWDKLKFLYYRTTKGFNRTRVMVMGISPQYRRLGIESGFFLFLRKVMDRKPQYTELELSWVGDFNPQMMALHVALGGVFHKRHITYRCMFDPTKPVIPMQVILEGETKTGNNTSK
jgi:hypothetical protein